MGRVAQLATSKPVLYVVTLLMMIGLVPMSPGRVHAADLEPRSFTPSDNRAGVIDVTYRASFTIATTGPVGSISFMFCDNTPLIDQPCNPPAGLSASAVVLGSQLGEVGFSVYSGSTANNIILTRPPAVADAGDVVTYDFNEIVNPSNAGPLFARFITYPTSDASGPHTDAGGMALYITNQVTINAEVPPYITFCLGESISGLDCDDATEPFSDMGSLKPSLTAAAQHQMLVATNANNGYSVFLSGVPMTSGNDTITPMAGTPSVKGTSQFGLNLRANTAPVIGQDATGPGFAAVTPSYGQVNQFRFNSGDAVVSNPLPDDYRKFTISYIVNVPPGQPGGVYASTLIYVCLANF